MPPSNPDEYAPITLNRPISDSDQGPQDGLKLRILERRVHERSELRPGELRWSQTFGLQDGPDRVAQVERLATQLLAHRQQRALPLRLRRLDPDGPERLHAHHVREAARVVAVGLVAEPSPQRGRGVRAYGVLIEGHGGVLDCVDSLLFAAPLFYYVVRALHA